MGTDLETNSGSKPTVLHRTKLKINSLHEFIYVCFFILTWRLHELYEGPVAGVYCMFDHFTNFSINVNAYNCETFASILLVRFMTQLL